MDDFFDQFFHFLFGNDDFDYVIASAPASPMAFEEHPLLEELRDDIDCLARDLGRTLDGDAGDYPMTNEQVKIPVHRPVDDPVLSALDVRPFKARQIEQLNLFTAEELGEIYVGRAFPRSEQVVLGALLLDRYDYREGFLASAAFNESVAHGCDPTRLSEDIRTLARFVFAGALHAKTNMLDYFRQCALLAPRGM
jgi:hypothetical protein